MPQSLPLAPGRLAAHLTRERAYWLLQGVSWSALAAFHVALLVAQDHATPAMVSGFVLASVLGIMGTHTLRRRLRHHGWLALGTAGLALRLVLASVSLAAVIALATLALERGMGQPLRSGPVQLVAMLVYWSVLTGGWSACYLTLHFLHVSRKAERERWQLQAMVRESELETLRSQLDPHFMFNCLNGIRGLVAEDGERAREMITRLATILRYSLQAAREPTVPLETELDMVNSYLALESVRLEERLRVRLDIPDHLLQTPVPPMMIQSLVENGIKHGVATLVEGGRIELAVRNDAGALVVEIRSSGRLGGGSGESPGVGLRNARERLRLLYGSGASLSLEQEEPGLVLARLVLPGEEDDARAHH